MGLNFLFVILIISAIVFFIVKQRRGKAALREGDELENEGEYENISSRTVIEQRRLRAEMDQLLERISEKGIASLSRKERLRLETISNQLKDDQTG